MTEVTLGKNELELVTFFWYFGNCLSLGSIRKLASISWCRVALVDFNGLMPIPTFRVFPLTARIIVQFMHRAPCKWNMGPNIPTWFDLRCLQPNDRNMIPWMCDVTTNSIQGPNQQDLRGLLGEIHIDYLETVHPNPSTQTARPCQTQWGSALMKVQKLNPTGGHGRGRPKNARSKLSDAFGLHSARPNWDQHFSDLRAWSGTLINAIRLDLFPH